MTDDLLVLVPSRGRPQSVQRMVDAWDATDAWDHARLVYVVDADDPTLDSYFQPVTTDRGLVQLVTLDKWLPLVPKLNQVATAALRMDPDGFAIAYFGDDHLPRTVGWAKRYLDALRALGSGFVYCDDGFQGERLATQFAVTTDVVRALGSMVPAPVEHLYCDNVVMEIGKASGALTYLPDVLIEHMHPMAHKAELDEGYARFNSADQYAKDGAAFREWAHDPLGLAHAARTVRALREMT
jgi:hypothetical protein